MKYMIASDLHGSTRYGAQLIAAYRREQADRLLLLGDLLYHGPRNALPEEYGPPSMAELLNEISSDILCVRGNCEAEVDQSLLNFPIQAEYCLISMGKHLIFATHGHRYHTGSLPPLHRGDILLHGHTHVPACEETEGILYLNPGSVSIPKNNSWHGYMTLENGLFLWKDLDGNEKMRYQANLD